MRYQVTMFYVKPLTHSSRPMKGWPFNCHMGMGLHGFKSS